MKTEHSFVYEVPPPPVFQYPEGHVYSKEELEAMKDIITALNGEVLKIFREMREKNLKLAEL